MERVAAGILGGSYSFVRERRQVMAARQPVECPITVHFNSVKQRGRAREEEEWGEGGSKNREWERGKREHATPYSTQRSTTN